MLALSNKIVVLFITLLLGNVNAFSQSEHWYLLQIVGQFNESELKGAMGYIQQIAPGCNVWFNDSRSNTIGCKSANPISWPQVITEMRAHGFYLADVTDCRCHHTDTKALSSIYFIEACYYASHADNAPEAWQARLNEDEYYALPEEVRNYYEEEGNFILVVK